MKTNKSLSKRIKITKTGKLLVRSSGQNHFNAKESRSSQMNNKRGRTITMKNKDLGRYFQGGSGR
ncbi:MAG: 50S ribosomal protein L35 [Candidatus Vogelbacteria bacterium]|nr:50S ribosomal protein L35 [Candidatus Vogelbacteria bacterium]